MKRILPCVILLLLISTNSVAQNRNYGIIYTNNLKGGHTMFGNTILARETNAMNDFSMSNTSSYSNGRTSQYGNDFSNMQYVDVDGNGITSLMPYGGQWRYYSVNNYSNIPPVISSLNWKEDNYNHTDNWSNINAPFGIGYSGDYSPAQTNRRTYYLRRDITINNPAQYSSIKLTAQYDDGIVIYINGVERGRANISAADPLYNTLANGTREADDGDYVINLSPSYFNNGNNQIAVEIHQGSNSSSDLYFNMQLEGVDATTASTFNSSSADLLLPVTGTNSIKYARLYWGGKAISANYSDAQLKSVKIRKGTSGSYTSITAVSLDKVSSGTLTSYQSYADITNFIKNSGAGTYTVADVPASTGSSITGGGYAGWTIVVVYENLLQPYRSVRVYDGFLEIQDGGSRSITLSGLNVPMNATMKLSDAYMSVMAWEGDANLGSSSGNPNGDYVRVNNIAVSNGVNPSVNMWNGTISKNGAHITTKMPDYKNQMGIDIDEVEVGAGYGINPGDQNVSVQFGTEQDQYFPSLFAFSIIMKEPTATVETSIIDINGGSLNVNDQLYFMSDIKNTGEGAAYGVHTLNYLPSNVSFIPSSIEIWNGSAWVPYTNATKATDPSTGKEYIDINVGTGATATTGGQLNPNESLKVRFKVVVNSAGTVTNTAALAATNQGASQSYSDESSAALTMDQVLPVKFKEFKGIIRNNLVNLVWSTVTEENTSHFEIERSTDARNFTKIGELKAYGNSNVEKTYQFSETVSGSLMYYRLKVVDFDGKVTYSKVIALSQNSAALNQVTTVLYPNPLQAGQDLKLKLTVDKEEDINIRLLNSSGSLMMTMQKNVQPGSNILLINDLYRLGSGIYVIQVVGRRVNTSLSFIKN